jgi:hypothetical protein
MVSALITTDMQAEKRSVRRVTDPFSASARPRLAGRQRNLAPVWQFDETANKLAGAFDDVFGALGQAF